MEKIRNNINKVVESISWTMLMFMTILVAWQVITRFVLNNPSTITEALAKYMFLWLTMIMAGYLVGKREHMALEIIVMNVSKKMQCIFGIISESVIFLFMLIVLGYGGGYISLNSMNQTDMALPVPIGIIYMALPIGGILAAFYSFCNILDIYKKFAKLKKGEIK
ncbi:MAG: TRAP transporter small permease [Elusimicrobiota bacterium]|jgi:TRAP-type C4-dicarboxylate transport system permease small subunit|nr:TRAP transporter small permease [Elusimicrobiota bacterium]